jgi:N-acetylated-alpha-linked acidic dipeptidase
MNFNLNYNSVSWMEEYGDPTFEYHQTMVRLWALLAYRLSGELILPMYPLDYVLVMQQHLVELNATVHTAELKKLTSALHGLYKISTKFESKVQDLRDSDFNTSSKHKKHKKFVKKVTRVNERLVHFERAFIQEELLVDRPWYKHAVYGPSARSGLIEAFPSLLELTALNETDIALAHIIKNAQTILSKGKYHKSSVIADDEVVF